MPEPQLTDDQKQALERAAALFPGGLVVGFTNGLVVSVVAGQDAEDAILAHILRRAARRIVEQPRVAKDESLVVVPELRMRPGFDPRAG